MFYKFTLKEITVEAPTEEEAWDELFHQTEITADYVEKCECTGEE